MPSLDLYTVSLFDHLVLFGYSNEMRNFNFTAINISIGTHINVLMCIKVAYNGVVGESSAKCNVVNV